MSFSQTSLLSDVTAVNESGFVSSEVLLSSVANASVAPHSPEDLLRPNILAPHAANETNADIAPWIEPPSPPSKRSWVAHKSSLASFRQGSAGTVFARSRGSESASIAESYTSTQSDMTFRDQGSPQDRKGKSSMKIFTDIIKKSRSLTRLPDPDRLGIGSSTSLLPSQLSIDTFMTDLPVPRSPSPPPPPKKDKPRVKRRVLNKPQAHVQQTSESIPTIDLNFDQIDQIIDRNAIVERGPGPSMPPPGSSQDMDTVSALGSTLPMPPSPTSSIFSNPFLPSSSLVQRNAHLTHDLRKVSPKSILPPVDRSEQPGGEVTDPATVGSWTAPESWAVEKDGEEEEEAAESSSEDGESLGTGTRSTSGITEASGSGSKTKSRHKKHSSSKQSASSGRYRVRIYRADGSYHVAPILLQSTVADINPSLDKKLVMEKPRETHKSHPKEQGSLDKKPVMDKPRETHKLYLKERGRERILAPTERPASIVRRRLEQAGYDQADSLDFLGAEDMTFLMKFVYKSQLLGPTTDDLVFDHPEHIDLTGHGLPTIPIILHQHASTIVTLNLSRNPMVEIPLDFIQSCTTLRELRLSNMAMKKVPQSVRHSASLHRLDLSCNRIMDLDDAALDRIPDLSTLKLQNNRMEQLPWYFPRLQNLTSLNISNNKFVHVPRVICGMESLKDLDMSFNMITVLPEEICGLSNLQRLVIVGNQVTRLPTDCASLINLRQLDCRRNNISDLTVAYTIPKLEELLADHNIVHALDLSLGPSMKTLDASYNDITILKLVPGSLVQSPYALTSLDVSHAKLSSLDDFALSQLSSLKTLKLDHNSFRFIPDSLGDLTFLESLSCSDNQLDALPSTIGQLGRLETLDVHNNSLMELPVTLWNCGSLVHINVTSNLLSTWHEPLGSSLIVPPATGISLEVPASPPSRTPYPHRKPSNADSIMSSSSSTMRPLPPLAHSLERLYVGENRLTDEVLGTFSIFRELQVLNLSFNEIQELPSSFFKSFHKLEELYLSGNQLTSIPTENLDSMHLSVLFLNGNKLQTLPKELAKVPSLTVIDVGSNLLRYNILNWQFDWNWNFNRNLKYLNLSGNKRLEIGSGGPKPPGDRDLEQTKVLADFSGLTQLRVLGLMDVTTTSINIPEEGEDRRVRTSPSEVNKMSYGIADTISKTGLINMFDLVVPGFRDHKDEAIFAMFGRARAGDSNNHLSKFVADNFKKMFKQQLSHLNQDRHEGVPDALRRSFLRLNKNLHDHLYSTPHRKMSQVSVSDASTSSSDMYTRAGASGIVLYFVDKMLYVANAGYSLAVISNQGAAELISVKHDPFDRREIARIRAAEGWVSQKGLIHDEIDTSRSFGFFHDFPVVNARPDIHVRKLTEQDEFVIVANRGLWDYISYQTAVDIARSERAEPTIAAQKLRDFAISYGADGSTMIMVISVADLFASRSRQQAADAFIDSDTYGSVKKRGGKKTDIADRTITRLDGEISPPIGHLALVFTDIRNSTQLWEANAGMPTAMRLHNSLLRRHLRLCGGYVVKTEGDAFMCSFPTTLAALWWCLIVQQQLLHEAWPLEILECDEGKEVRDSEGRIIARGLSVRMSVHCGTPVCEPDPITNRMDYFGPMVIRAARLNGYALGGQIMCSADVVREINARVREIGPDTEYSDFQPTQAVEAIRRMDIAVVPAGEIKLKGLEVPETVSVIYPGALAARQDLEASGARPSTSSPARVQLSIAQVRELASLCLRFEALSSGRVFRPLPERNTDKTSEVPLGLLPDDEVLDPSVMYGDPALLLPPMNDNTSDFEIMMHLESLSVRLENATNALVARIRGKEFAATVAALERDGKIDAETLKILSSMLSS
ncbi:PP2C-domain-containing protein [Leucogyrophana mollusca]|uniref:PP2C-domain-containing protein n=1 Tax=Leucogyrophana mollusca TaxID=85980 RepID=A0ACB8BWC8_9AGAM|nr:PP2C-domain-containing protein [Leucogyrophana mollusca]